MSDPSKRIRPAASSRVRRRSSDDTAGPGDAGEEEQAQAPARKRGRPAGRPGGLIDREKVIATALAMTRTVPLAELSMVRVAGEMGVTQALIHYYLPTGRDGLTSGVMNAFYRPLYEQWPVLTGGWREQIHQAAQLLFDAYVQYAGIATYVASHNRFQVAQMVEEGEPDYGLLMMEQFAGTVCRAGLSAHRTSVHCHLLITFIQACAQSTVTHRWPREHAQHLNEKLASLDREAFPSCHFIRKSLGQLDAQEAFVTGLETMLEGMAVEVRRASRQRRVEA